MNYIPGIGSTGPYPLGSPLYKGGQSGYVPQLGMPAQQQQSGGGYMPMQQQSTGSSLGMSGGGGSAAVPAATPAAARTPIRRSPTGPGGLINGVGAEWAAAMGVVQGYQTQDNNASIRSAIQSGVDSAPQLNAALLSQPGYYDPRSVGSSGTSKYSSAQSLYPNTQRNTSKRLMVDRLA